MPETASEQSFHTDLFTSRQKHGRTRRRAVPFLPGFRAHRHHLIQLQLALLDQRKGHMGRHHLGHRSGWHQAVSIAREQGGPGRLIDQQRDRRGGVDGRCGDNGRTGDQRED